VARGEKQLQSTPTVERAWPRSVSALADAAERWTEHHRWPIAGFLSIIYFVLTSASAMRKLVWDDELFTLFISGTRDLAGIWQALLTGADQHPPSFYFLTHALFATLGISHFTLRLPAIVGFWVMMICLCKIIGDRTSPLYGLAAMVIPISSKPVFYYATEARGYGLALGFAALATLCWLKAAEYPERRRYVAGLAFSLAGAVGSHYYAILLLIPVVIGEGVRLVQTRRLRPAIGLACAAALVPIVLFLPTIRSASGFSAHFWARPESWKQPFLSIKSVFVSVMEPTICALLVTAWISGKLRPKKQSAEVRRDQWAPHEMAFFSGLLCLPLAGYLIAVFVTQAYHLRYVISFVIGLFVLLLLASYRALGRTRVGGFLLFLGLAAFALSHEHSSIREAETQQRDFRTIAAHLQDRGNDAETILIGDVMVFHQLSFYAPRRLARRVVYAADPGRSIRYLGHDTIDRCLLSLRPWFPERIEPYGQVLKSYGTFLAYGYVGEWSWLTNALTDDRIETSLIGRDGSRILLLARPRGSAASPGGTGLLPPRPFGHRGQIVSGDTETLCAAWMNDRNCGVFANIR
jgi:hypothetical protein